MSDADDPIMSGEQGEEIPTGTDTPAPSVEPVASTPPPATPTEPVLNLGLYVLASGPNAGQAVPVMVMESHEYPEGLRANLAKVEEPNVRFQTLALCSDGKEPGTWHWA